MNKYIVLIVVLVLVIVFLMANKCSIKAKDDDYEPYESGTASNSLLSSDANGNIKLLSYPAFPKGMIMLWNGAVSSIPAGWSLCDGATYNGYTTPDLRGRFVVGASTAAGPGLTLRNVGAKGGEEAHVLTVDEIPSHNHRIPNIYGSGQQDRGAEQFNWFTTSGYARELSPATTYPTGGDKAHNTMPPFYALCYICYTG